MQKSETRGASCPHGRRVECHAGGTGNDSDHPLEIARCLNRALVLSMVALTSLLSTQAALAAKASKCVLNRFAEIPVTMSGTRPLVPASINGNDAWLMIDSGAARSFLTLAAAEKFELKLGPRVEVRGTGGRDDARLGYAKDFSLTGFYAGKTFHDVQFTVYGDSTDADGILGRNVFGQGDMEFDLANGMVRLFQEKGCDTQSLAYWSEAASVAVMSVKRPDATGRHIIGNATLNDKRIQVIFDSGAWRSILTLRAAARAGIQPGDDGVIAAGIGKGVGRKRNETSLARFDVLDLGGEQIKNALIRIGDIDISDIGDMLLGADFFLSHRIYISNRLNKVFFTYNGGRVFDLSAPQKTTPTVATINDASTTPAADDTVVSEEAVSASSMNAAELQRRGAASAGRMEFANAIADFDEAIRLDPNDPEKYYQRGMARLQNLQGTQALEDFTRALTIKPDHVQTLIERGGLQLAAGRHAAARADFDTATELTPQDAGVSLRIAQIYARYRHFDATLHLLDRWIERFPKEDRLPAALEARCRARTMLGKQLDLALADCNAALRKGPLTSEGLNSRALLQLRRGDFERAIADFTASLERQPRSATALYGLGLAQLRTGSKADADDNIRAALAIAPSTAEFYAQQGLAP